MAILAFILTTHVTIVYFIGHSIHAARIWWPGPDDFMVLVLGWALGFLICLFAVKKLLQPSN